MLIEPDAFARHVAYEDGAYGEYIDLEPGSTVYTLWEPGEKLSILYGVMLNSDGEWVCEIDEYEPVSPDGKLAYASTLACWQGITPQSALDAALVELTSHPTPPTTCSPAEMALVLGYRAFAVSKVGYLPTLENISDIDKGVLSEFLPQNDEEKRLEELVSCAREHHLTHVLAERF